MLLIARAPVRISFGGGGTDLPAYFNQFGGAVLNTAINRYVYAIMSSGATEALQVISSDFRVFYRHTGAAEMTADGELGLAKAVLREFGDYEGIDLFLSSQVPPGTGLGSSGAVAVCMVAALAAWQGRTLSKIDMAEMACDIGINKMKLPSGKQDEYGSAMGGLNQIVFTKDETRVHPLDLPSTVMESLQQRVMLFFTGKSRNSGDILKKQSNASQDKDPATLERMHQIKALGQQMVEALQRHDLDSFGDLLHQSWLQKRGVVNSISNDLIDQAYAAARDHGALGGKIAGAGGGGFMMLYCHEDKQPVVTETLQAMGLSRMDFRFDFEGPQILLHNR
ncbi:MAG: GHMP kinase [Anaerolineaceae bacterium]|nr:GHMP kinase [Anaerolineaceae bacterium]